MAENKIKKILIIDGSFFCYFYHYSEPILINDLALQAFLRAISSIRYFLASEFEVEVVWDGHAQWRYDLLPEYKSSRRKNEELAETRAYLKKTIMPLIMNFLKYVPVTQYYSADDEADDLAANRVHQLENSEEPVAVRLLCSDTDWLQLVSPRCDWWNFRTKKIVTIADFGKPGFYDFPAQVAESKTLAGDVSDDIPGLPNIAEKRALQVLRKYGGLDALIQAIEQGRFKENKNFQAFLEPEAIATIARNKELIFLKERPVAKLRSSVGAYDGTEVHKILKQFNQESQAPLWSAANSKVLQRRQALANQAQITLDLFSPPA